MSADMQLQTRLLSLAAARAERAVKPQRDSEAENLDPLAALARWVVTAEQVDNMKQTRIIWRDLIAMSHLAGWCGPANAGKTQVAKMAAAELAQDFTVLFFQEDASAGDLPALHEHAASHGYHLLNRSRRCALWPGMALT
jgi:hypothetical protein